MKVLENLRIDTWYGIIFYFGIGLIFSSFYFKIDFLQAKHLCGFGLGLVCIGISYFIAEKHATNFIPGGMLTTKITQHNLITILLLVIGIGLVGLFEGLIVKGLV